MKSKSQDSRVRKTGTSGRGNGDGNGHGQQKSGAAAHAHAPTAAEKRMPSPVLTSDVLVGGGLLSSETKYKKDLLAALTALKKGDFSVRLPVDWPGLDGKLADTFNDVIEITDRLSPEATRLSRVV